MTRPFILAVLSVVIIGVCIQECKSIETETFSLYLFSEYKHLLSIPVELDNSPLALGRTFTTSESLYEPLNSNLHLTGILLWTCVATHLDISDPNYQRAREHVINYTINHERKCTDNDTLLEGRGALQCLATYSLSQGTITAIGLIESRRDDNTTFTWAISGGTGSYRNIRGTITVQYTAARHCERVKTRSACQIKMVVSLRYPAPERNSIEPTLVFYEYVGAIEKTIEPSITNSLSRSGHREFSGNPIYSRNPSERIFAPSGYVSSVCYETLLDAHDADYLIVASINPREFRNRLGNNTTGRGVSQCHATLDVYEGTLTFQGWRENRFDENSTLAITGGTGIYNYSKGFIHRSYVDPLACQVSRSLSTTTTLSCIARLEIYLESYPKKNVSECFSILDGRGANMKVSSSATYSSVFGLGESLIVGSPLYQINNNTMGLRVGYSAGYYYKTYLDSQLDREAFEKRWDVLPGAHTRALMWGGRGLHEGLVSLYLNNNTFDSLVLAGSFEEALSFPNNYAVVGGTGRYAGVVGSVSGFLANEDGGTLCGATGYRNTTTDPLICVYLLEICIIY